MHFKIFHTTFIIMVLYYPSFSQVGVGALGLYQYPGLQSSDQYNIRFESGAGYGFYAKHDIFKIAEKPVFLRYLAKISKHEATLPGAISGSKDSEYEFSNFSLDILYEFFVKNSNKYYTGLSVNLLRTLSEGKFRATYTGSSIYPSLFLGWERNFIKGFDFFSELRLAYGETDADGGPERIPITGVAIFVGITMYVSE